MEDAIVITTLVEAVEGAVVEVDLVVDSDMILLVVPLGDHVAVNIVKKNGGVYPMNNAKGYMTFVIISEIIKRINKVADNVKYSKCSKMMMVLSHLRYNYLHLHPTNLLQMRQIQVLFVGDLVEQEMLSLQEMHNLTE